MIVSFVVVALVEFKHRVVGAEVFVVREFNPDVVLPGVEADGILEVDVVAVSVVRLFVSSCALVSVKFTGSVVEIDLVASVDGLLLMVLLLTGVIEAASEVCVVTTEDVVI